MKISLIPKTHLGQWSVKLIIAFVFFLTAFYGVIGLGYRGGDTFFSQSALAIPILIAGTCGIIAFFTGLITIIKDKEYSLLVFLSTAIGLFVFIFILGEILAPH